MVKVKSYHVGVGALLGLNLKGGVVSFGTFENVYDVGKL